MPMKTAIVVLVISMGAAWAADPPQHQAAGEGRQAKRLGSFTWDLNAHKLVWVIEKGTIANGEFRPASEERYEISPDQAVMSNEDQRRGFDDVEAANLQKLLDVLSLYCAESVRWWEEGQGLPLDPGAIPGPSTKPDRPGGQKPVRVGEPQPKKPEYRVPEGDLIAALMRLH
ncbi:MAG: hypothetical protein ACHQ5A_07585 [Opitutales bacterium]